MRKRLPGILVLAAILVACADNQRPPTEVVNAQAAGASLNSLGTQEPLFTLVMAPALTAEQNGLLARVRGRPSSAQVNVGRLSSTPHLLLQPGKAVVFQLSPTEQVVALGKALVQRAPDDISWSGEIENRSGTVHLVLTSKGVTGTVQTLTTLYHIEPIGAGLHALTRIDKFPPEHPPGAPSGAIETSPNSLPTNGSSAQSAVSPRFQLNSSGLKSAGLASMSQLTRIDVLVAYTPSAAAATGDINGLIQLAFDESNASYSNSAINLTIAPAYVAQVNYTEAGYAQDVAALQSPSDGIMDIVHTWRNQYLADVVVLIVNYPPHTACGQASTILATASTAFAVVDYVCATGNYSFAHEIGHLQGARHDRAVDNTNTPFQFGHGYVEPNHLWRTIMAYPNACGSCQRVQYWSNPNVTYPVTGQVMGTTTYEDNARVLNQTKSDIASFRSPPALSVSISGPQYVTRYQSAQYFATPTNGTAPYTYEWRSRQCTDGGGYNCGAWQNWFSTGAQNYTYASINSCGLARNELQARVTDAVPSTATSYTYPIWITNPC